MSRREEEFAKREPVDRLEARIHHVLLLADAFFAYLKLKEGSIAPKSLTGKAISYCLKQEALLRAFLTDGSVPMTNNTAERSIRPFTVGRNNWFQNRYSQQGKSKCDRIQNCRDSEGKRLNPYKFFR